MRWLNRVPLAPKADGYRLRDDLAQMDVHQAPIREVEPPIERSAAGPRFQEAVQTLQGFRDMGRFTATQLRLPSL